MQTVQDSFAEELAMLFHHYRELLARDFGLQSSDGSCSWEQLLPSQRKLMVATARAVLLHLAEQQSLAVAQNMAYQSESNAA
jgi:hypothetical protein